MSTTWTVSLQLVQTITGRQTNTGVVAIYKTDVSLLFSEITNP